MSKKYEIPAGWTSLEELFRTIQGRALEDGPRIKSDIFPGRWTVTGARCFATDRDCETCDLSDVFKPEWLRNNCHVPDCNKILIKRKAKVEVDKYGLALTEGLSRDEINRMKEIANIELI